MINALYRHIHVKCSFTIEHGKDQITNRIMNLKYKKPLIYRECLALHKPELVNKLNFLRKQKVKIL